uniref:Uncharacterized protein n=1 Tax=Anguilla anguilla TaxID=7936 RepID=A0A0E9THE8_ANGAN
MTNYALPHRTKLQLILVWRGFI